MNTTPTKQQIDPADYMLLYIRINKIGDQYNTVTKLMERKFWFEHVQNRFAPADHIWSADKNVIANAYDQLEENQYYLIFAHRVNEIADKKKNGKTFGRWVWRAALNMPDTKIRQAYKFYTKNSTEPKLCLRFADQLMNPSIAPELDEFDFTQPQDPK